MILTSRQAREIDRRAREEHNLSTLVLMENAGAACAAEAARMRRRGDIVIVCGKGNNGGDGFVCGRHLAAAGLPVRIFLLADPGQVSGEAAVNLRVLMSLDIPVVSLMRNVAPLKAALRRCGLAVDALLGTGARGPVSGLYRQAIEAMNAWRGKILSVDIPSGLDADTGESLGACVRAATTVTFIARKKGMLRKEGPQSCGRVLVAQIGFPVSARHI